MRNLQLEKSIYDLVNNLVETKCTIDTKDLKNVVIKINNKKEYITLTHDPVRANYIVKTGSSIKNAQLVGVIPFCQLAMTFNYKNNANKVNKVVDTLQ